MTTVCITTHVFGLNIMETMANPLNQWHHDPSGAPKPGPYPDFRPSLLDRRIPRLSTPPMYPLRLPVPRPELLRQDSTHSSHASTTPPLERSPRGPPTLAHAHCWPGPPRGTIYDSKSPSCQSSPASSGRADPKYVTNRQPSEPPSSFSHYALAKNPQVTSRTPSQSGTPLRRPPTPRSSYSTPQGVSEAASPDGSVAKSPRRDPRDHMAVHALLNDETAFKVVPASPASVLAPLAPPGRPDEAQYELCLRQQPANARSCGFGDRDRRVIDPPPIIQLKVVTPGLSHEEIRSKLQYPRNILHCSIWSESGTEEVSNMPEEYTRQKRLMGNLVASPFVGIDENGEEGCFFCFPDISCRTPGKYRLKFSMISLNHRPGARSPVKVEVLSDVFQTFSAKEFPGMSESSALAKALKHQGCNIPTKKGNETARGGKRDDSEDFSDEDEKPRKKRPRNNQ